MDNKESRVRLSVPNDSLREASEAVRLMWRAAALYSDVRRADANDTIHFLHEEASEVAKVAMKLGLIGSHDYKRSEKVQETVYTYADLVAEVGDVLLMALTLAEAFDLDAGVCLQEALIKFYVRAGAIVPDLLNGAREPMWPRERLLVNKDTDAAVAGPTLILPNPEGRYETPEERCRFTSAEGIRRALGGNEESTREAEEE